MGSDSPSAGTPIPREQQSQETGDAQHRKEGEPCKNVTGQSVMSNSAAPSVQPTAVADDRWTVKEIPYSCMADLFSGNDLLAHMPVNAAKRIADAHNAMRSLFYGC